MPKLKPITKKAIPAAIEKARHYRLLNEPAEAESICLDVLEVDPKNQKAIVTLLLALTDQFRKGYAVSDTTVEDLLPRIRRKYERDYYAGIIFERRAKAALQQGSPGSNHAAYEWLQDAMDCFQRAQKLRKPGNDEAILRWNTCARMIDQNRLTAPPPDEQEHQLE